jgi:hypothetical protein
MQFEACVMRRDGGDSVHLFDNDLRFLRRAVEDLVRPNETTYDRIVVSKRLEDGSHQKVIEDTVRDLLHPYWGWPGSVKLKDHLMEHGIYPAVLECLSPTDMAQLHDDLHNGDVTAEDANGYGYQLIPGVMDRVNSRHDYQELQAGDVDEINRERKLVATIYEMLGRAA